MLRAREHLNSHTRAITSSLVRKASAVICYEFSEINSAQSVSNNRTHLHKSWSSCHNGIFAPDFSSNGSVYTVLFIIEMVISLVRFDHEPTEREIR